MRVLSKHLICKVGGSNGKASAYHAGDLGSVPGWERSSGGENGNPLLYSCLENPVDGEAWWAAVHGVAKSGTRLSGFTSLRLSDSSQWVAFPDAGWRVCEEGCDRADRGRLYSETRTRETCLCA